MARAPCVKLTVYFSEGVNQLWAKTHIFGTTRELINNIRPRQTTTSENTLTPFYFIRERRNPCMKEVKKKWITSPP